MKLKAAIYISVFVLLAFFSRGQSIKYSQPDRDDNKRINFEIIGKLGDNYMIYKNARDKNWISLLDENMQQVKTVNQDYLPNSDKLINVDFINYNTHALMIYQYRKKNVVHCEAVKLDAEGQKVGKEYALDTSHIGFAGDSKVYSVVVSENKEKIMVFKINSKDKKLYRISTILLNNQLDLIRYTNLTLKMEDREDYLGEFHIDNEGDMIFAKFERSRSDELLNTQLIFKRALSDNFEIVNLDTKKFLLDELHIKPDNYNNRYIITSFYYLQRRGNTEGYYYYVWDKARNSKLIEDTLAFSDELRREARGNSSVKTAFNDFFINNIISKRDGGFLITSESSYTNSRGMGYNRWNSLYGLPYMRSMDYYSYSPFYSPVYGYGLGGFNRWGESQNVRYLADNVVITSFDKTGKKEWSSVISKEQFSDESDNTLSYMMVNTGGQLHFLFNNMEKRLNLLSDFTLLPDGKINRNPTLKNLDRGYTFMPKYGKQISSRVVIVPCLYRNYICFAKIEFE